MSIWANELGGAEVDTSTDPLAGGAYFTAIEPEGTPADHVVVLALTTYGHIESPEVGVAVCCAEYGAIPPDWRFSTEQFSAEEFLQAYRPTTPAERQALTEADDAARAAADAAAADAETRRRQSNPTYTRPAPKA